MKGIVIDAQQQTFRYVEWQEGDVPKYTGGSLTLAFNYPRNDPPQSMFWADVVYCDDEGLMKPYDYFFRTRSRRLDDQPIPGMGFVTGPDIVDDKGDYIRSADPQVTIAQLEKDIEFLTRAQFVAWIKAKKDEPS